MNLGSSLHEGCSVLNFLLGGKLGSVHTLLPNRTSRCVLGRPTRTGPSSTLENPLRKPGEATQMKGKQAPRMRAGKDSSETPK